MMIKTQSVDLNPNPILQVTSSGEIHYINPAAIRLLNGLGYSVDQYVLLLPPNFIEIAANCLVAETAIPATQMLLGDRYVLWSSFFFDDNNKIEFHGMDVTRMVRVEKSLRESKQKAEEGEKLKAAFLDNMSHEIRTPLNSLLGFMNLLYGELIDTLADDQRMYFDMINQNGNRLERTMREILDISHFSSGTYRKKISSIHIGDLLKQVVDDKLTESKEKKLTFGLSVTGENLTVLTDEYCLTQAVTHLIDNAIKYTDKGSVKVGVSRNDKEILISIKDTGPGIEEKVQRQIFVAFNQGTTGHSKQYQGIGLGLSLVRVYLDTIGARVDLDSELGKGSHFKICIST